MGIDFTKRHRHLSALQLVKVVIRFLFEYLSLSITQFPMSIFKAKDFKNRRDLEDKVRSEVDLTPVKKPDYIIEGTKEELNKLFLSPQNTFWGILVSESAQEKVKKSVKKVKIKRAGVKSKKK